MFEKQLKSFLQPFREAFQELRSFCRDIESSLIFMSVIQNFPRYLRKLTIDISVSSWYLPELSMHSWEWKFQMLRRVIQKRISKKLFFRSTWKGLLGQRKHEWLLVLRSILAQFSQFMLHHELVRLETYYTSIFLSQWKITLAYRKKMWSRKKLITIW